jgi:hypothetical protein
MSVIASKRIWQDVLIGYRSPIATDPRLALQERCRANARQQRIVRAGWQIPGLRARGGAAAGVAWGRQYSSVADVPVTGRWCAVSAEPLQDRKMRVCGEGHRVTLDI